MVLLDLELVVYQLDPVPKWAVQGVLFDPVREHSVRLGAGGACSDAVGPWVGFRLRYQVESSVGIVFSIL